MKTKYALVLSGGGFKGAFQLGALNFLADNWNRIDPSGDPMHFDIIAGVSVGALNGAMLSMNRLDALNELWREVAEKGVEEIYTSPFIDTKANGDKPKMRFDAEVLQEQFLPDFRFQPSIWEGIKAIFSKKQRKKMFKRVLEEAAKSIKESLAGFRSIADNEPLYHKLKAHLDRDAIQGSNFLCGFVSLDDGGYASVNHQQFKTNEDFIKGVLASTAMPIVWEPVENIQTTEGKIRNSVDGGIRNNAPLGDVIDAIQKDEDPNVEYTIIVINCNNGNILTEDFTENNIFQIALRSMQEITLSEIFNNDLKHFLQVNEIVSQAKAQGLTLFKQAANGNARQLGRPLRHFHSIIINPEDGVLGDLLAANQKLVAQRMNHGRQKAEEAIDNFFTEHNRQAAAA